MDESSTGIATRALAPGDPPVFEAAFAAIGWRKPAPQYVRYLDEQAAGTRDVVVAEVDGAFAGYLTVLWEPSYPPFRDAQIPEIQDLNVLPQVRRRGVASRLLDEAESRIAARSNVVGIGFGLTANYGAAQRLYVLRGYVPDARGIMSRERPVGYLSHVQADDDLVLYLTKRLRTRASRMTSSSRPEARPSDPQRS
jgi:GNAT superfamily N-acetyltransferase